MNKKTNRFKYAFLGILIALILAVIAVNRVRHNALELSQSFFTERISIEFNVDRFPLSYREKINLTNDSLNIREQSYQDWSLIWHKSNLSEALPIYQFSHNQLSVLKDENLFRLREPHPIFDAPQIQEVDKQMLPEIVSIDSYLQFQVQLNEIVYQSESQLDNNPDYLDQVKEWERTQTQLIIFCMYLIYLDQQKPMPDSIYSDLNYLAENVGNDTWYKIFYNHLEKYFPSGG